VEEIKALPETFTEANKNIVCFGVADVLRMLEDSDCEHLPGLGPLAGSSDASLLDDILKDIQRIVGRLVWRWWAEHGVPECMRRLKEGNKVSFLWRASSCDQNFCFFVLTAETVLQVEGHAAAEGDDQGGDGTKNPEADDKAAAMEALEDATWNVAEDRP
jgi:hypothetical protein